MRHGTSDRPQGSTTPGRTRQADTSAERQLARFTVLL